MRILFLLFIIVPIVEMVVLIKVGEVIGAWYTVGLVLLTAVIGINLLRQQGLSTLMRANQRINSGELPAQEMVEGFLLAIGGALLLTPGFVTDTMGFACLIPPLRRLLVSKLLGSGRFFMAGQGPGYGPRGPAGRDPDVIEGEYRRDE
ncbi:FxsA family protein [Aestuariirhabdus litorea]|uniref:FxsA family protein n=1 Tax=Aestuariirhabdus litorea TaxID=2528527 RepID=A0A3P3VKR0_9GAMM|nr:FxsA family protein [Aestuariirhabdus litorea]RRJ83315.1 FxsA family protein [Aestuariirhabdus litorea]RWW93475.1 FxsA family protein [Endozoicomonadaceae bacterium GTF-13]